jgi:hypothetical protein
VLPASLEVAFWFALLTFPLAQFAILLLAQIDPNVIIRYLTMHGIWINLASFVPFLFAVVHAIVFLVSDPPGWNIATATIAGIVSVLVIILLPQLQSVLAISALGKFPKT